ncbi:MAG: hypothetical protein ACK4OP_12340 [Gemmobacter sp.]
MAQVVTMNPDSAEPVAQGMPQVRGIAGRTAGAARLSMNLTGFPPRRAVCRASPPWA